MPKMENGGKFNTKVLAKNCGKLAKTGYYL